MADRIQLRRGTSAKWTEVDPILTSGEPGFETDTGQLKIGDGVLRWSQLSYPALDSDIIYLSGAIDINTTHISELSGALDFTAYTGYDEIENQSFTHVSGGEIQWRDITELDEYPNYIDNSQQVLSHTSGVIQWEDVNTVGDISLLSIDVALSAHGFNVANTIYTGNTSGWLLAQADDVNTLGAAIVTAVADTDNFTYKTQGAFTLLSHGYTVGRYVYVSETTAGALTETEPISITAYSNPILYVLDENTLVILPYRASPSIPRSNDHRIILTSAAEYNVNDIDEVIVVKAATGGSDIILPDPSDTYYGFTVTIKKSDSTTEVVTVKSMYGDIDDVLGTTGIELTTQNEVVTAVCDSVNYTLI